MNANLQTFLGKFRKDIPSSTTFTLQTLDGGENDQDPREAGVEAVSFTDRIVKVWD